MRRLPFAESGIKIGRFCIVFGLDERDRMWYNCDIR